MLQGGVALGDGTVAVSLDVDRDLVFSREQLASALSLRGVAVTEDQTAEVSGKPHPETSKAPRVQVRRAGPEAVVVIHGQMSRRLALGSLQPLAAARLVALAVSDLVRSSMAVPLSLPPPDEPGADDDTVSEQPPLATVGLLGRAGGGANLDRPSFAVALEGSLLMWATLRGILGAGATFTLPAVDGETRLTMTKLSLRADLGWSPGALPRLEARLGVVVQPLWITGESGELTLSHQGVQVGADLAVLYQLRLTMRLDGTVGAGVDLFFNRMELLVRGTRTMATERVALWAGLGLRYRL